MCVCGGGGGSSQCQWQRVSSNEFSFSAFFLSFVFFLKSKVLLQVLHVIQKGM